MKFTTVVLSVLFINVTQAAEFVLPEKNFKIIGEEKYYSVRKGDYFQKIAEQYNIGFLALMAANPNVDPFLPLVDHELALPTKMILPFVKRQGIVINLPELRLYYFSPDSNKVHVFPVGIGREGLKTPRTISFISDKRQDPIWRPTTEMKERYLTEKGIVLADEVPAGPNNPFGKYALRIGHSEYLIHGSNQRFGIGMRASSGCIRMYDNDIKWMFDNVPVNTPITIVDQPIKMSYEGGQSKYVEIHQPLSDMDEYLYQQSVTQLVKFIGDDLSQFDIETLIESAKGLVVKVKVKVK